MMFCRYDNVHLLIVLQVDYLRLERWFVGVEVGHPMAAMLRSMCDQKIYMW